MFRPATTACLAAVVVLCTARTPAQTCTPHWADGLWASAPPGVVRALTSIGGGGDAELFIGTVSYGTAPAWVSSWDGLRLLLVAPVTGTLPAGPTKGVYAIIRFDDGAGPSLFVAGNFTHVGGVAAPGIARFDGASWTSVGGGTDGAVRALAVFDDGSGPMLYAAGHFARAGGAAALRVAAWDGRAWAPLGSGLAGGLPIPSGDPFPAGYALAVFDDGAGPALYVGGNFSEAGASPAEHMARWDGSAWSAVGGGVSSQSGGAAVLALCRADLGAGPSLYAGGQFDRAGAMPVWNAARWNGQEWHPVGTTGFDDRILNLAAADVGSGPALYAATSGSVPVFRLDGDAWTPISPGGGTAYALAGHEIGSGPQLMAGGSFASQWPIGTDDLAGWNGRAWAPIPTGGALTSVLLLRTLDLGTGPALFAFGGNQIAGQPYAGVARFDGSNWLGVAPAGQTAGPPRSVDVFDDGSGPAIYAAANLLTAPQVSVVRLVGTTWHPVGEQSFGGGAEAVRSFDAGSGPMLFAGGTFESGVRVWDGTTWSVPGGGLPAAATSWGVRDLEVADLGNGDRLYAAAGGSGLYRFDGATWTAVSAFGSAMLRGLAAFDMGDGPALYAFGYIPNPPPLGSSMARYDGRLLYPLVQPMNAVIIHDAIGFDDGSGSAIYAVGPFNSIAGTLAQNVARWRPGGWSAVGGGLNYTAHTLATFGGGGSALWVGGEFHAAGAVSSGHLARWMACPACYADCDGDGALTPADFACFRAQFVAASPYADCNADAALTVGDFGCFQTRFVLGCP